MRNQQCRLLTNETAVFILLLTNEDPVPEQPYLPLLFCLTNQSAVFKLLLTNKDPVPEQPQLPLLVCLTNQSAVFKLLLTNKDPVPEQPQLPLLVCLPPIVCQFRLMRSQSCLHCKRKESLQHKQVFPSIYVNWAVSAKLAAPSLPILRLQLQQKIPKFSFTK